MNKNISILAQQDSTKLSTLIIVLSIVFAVLTIMNKYVIFLYPLIVLILTLVQIEFGLSFIILTSGIQFTAMYPSEIGIFNPNAIQIIGMLLLCIIGLTKKRSIRINSTFVVFGLFTLYAFISLVLWAPDRFTAAKMLGKIIVMLLLLLLFSNTTIPVNRLLKMISFSGLISILIFNPIFYWLLEHDIFIDTLGRNRLVGGGFISTAYALFLGTCFIASILLYHYEKNKRYLFYSILFSAYAIMTYTRAVWIALLLTTTIFLIYRKDWLTLIGVFIVLFVLFNTVSQLFFLEGSTARSSQSELDRFSQGRTSLWMNFYHDFLRHPVRGLGLEYTTVYSEDATGILSLHSDPLRILYDLGLVGFCIYILFIILQIWSLIHLSCNMKLLSLFFIFYLICSSTGNVLNYIQLIGFQVFTILGITQQLDKSKQQ
jgi:hypothetical protein